MARQFHGDSSESGSCMETGTHADLLSWLHTEVQSLEDRREVWPVAHDDVLELDRAAGRPRLVRSVIFDNGRSLAFELVSVMQETFDSVDEVVISKTARQTTTERMN